MRFISFFSFLFSLLLVFACLPDPSVASQEVSVSVSVDLPTQDGGSSAASQSSSELNSIDAEEFDLLSLLTPEEDSDPDQFHDDEEDFSGHPVCSGRRVHTTIPNLLSREERNRIANLPACGPYVNSPVTREAGNGNLPINTVRILPSDMSNPGIGDNTISTGAACMFHKLKRAAAAAGHTLKINSGFRSLARQNYFHRCFQTNRCNINRRTGKAFRAATPGTSNHGNGIAVDIPVGGPNTAIHRWLLDNALTYGFCPTVADEAHHWEICRRPEELGEGAANNSNEQTPNRPTPNRARGTPRPRSSTRNRRRSRRS